MAFFTVKTIKLLLIHCLLAFYLEFPKSLLVVLGKLFFFTVVSLYLYLHILTGKDELDYNLLDVFVFVAKHSLDLAESASCHLLGSVGGTGTGSGGLVARYGY